MSNATGLYVIIFAVVAGAAAGLVRFLRFAERTERRLPPDDKPRP